MLSTLLIQSDNTVRTDPLSQPRQGEPAVPNISNAINTSSLSLAGMTGNGVSDFSSLWRNLGVGFSGIGMWRGPSEMEDIPNQATGITTGLNAIFGTLGFCGSVSSYLQAQKIGDTQESKAAVMGAAVHGSLALLGVNYMVARPVTIAAALCPSNPALHSAAKITGDIGSGLGLFAYLFSVGAEIYRLDSARRTYRTLYIGMTLDERINKFNKLLSFLNDPASDLSDSAAPDQDEKYAAIYRQEQKTLARQQVVWLKRAGVKITKQQVRDIYEAIRTRDEKECSTEGRKIVRERDKQRKIAKWTRNIGEATVTYLSKVRPDTLGEEIDKIDAMAKKHLSTVQWSAGAKACIYLGGVGVMMGFMLLSLGVLPATLPWILGLTISMGVVSIGEFGFAALRLQDLKQQAVSPGKYDYAIPGVTVGLVVAGLVLTVVLASCFSIGTVPLVVGVLAGTASLGMAVYHGYCIHRSHQNWVRKLREEVEQDATKLGEKEIFYLLGDKNGEIKENIYRTFLEQKGLITPDNWQQMLSGGKQGRAKLAEKTAQAICARRREMYMEGLKLASVELCPQLG